MLLSSLAIEFLCLSLLGLLHVTIATIKIDPVNRNFVDEYKRFVCSLDYYMLLRLLTGFTPFNILGCAFFMV